MALIVLHELILSKDGYLKPTTVGCRRAFYWSRLIAGTFTESSQSLTIAWLRAGGWQKIYIFPS